MLKLLRNFYHTFKFSTLIINFSEVWPRQILDLGKQFNLMIRLENVLKRSLEDVLKISWGRFLQDFLKTFWRRLENVLKTSWKRMAKTNILVLIKTSWRRPEEVFWRRVSKATIFVLIKTPGRRLEDVFWRWRWKTSSRPLHQEECLLGCTFL